MPNVLQICHSYYPPFLDCARQYAALFHGISYKVTTVYLQGDFSQAVVDGSASDEVIFLGYKSSQIGELKNRYTNAAHWVDAQVGRVVDTLTQQGMLENTIIITGDHGEEFMEKGFWGHNSSFVEEQTHTPFVMWVPNTPHAEINRLTSHLDVSATLLPLLGAPKDMLSYGLGSSLLDESARKFIVVSDWHSISVQTNDMKYRIPYLNKGLENWQPTSMHDAKLSSIAADAVVTKNQNLIMQAMQNCSNFLAKHKT